jgi:hypothetical protein
VRILTSVLLLGAGLSACAPGGGSSATPDTIHGQWDLVCTGSDLFVESDEVYVSGVVDDSSATWSWDLAEDERSVSFWSEDSNHSGWWVEVEDGFASLQSESWCQREAGQSACVEVAFDVASAGGTESYHCAGVPD